MNGGAAGGPVGLRTALSWLGQRLRVPHLTPWKDPTLEDEAALLRFTRELAVDLSFVALLGILTFQALWWPLDRWIGPDEQFVVAFSRLRTVVVAQAAGMLALVSFTAWARRHILVLAPAMYAVIMGTLGDALGSLGERGVVWLADANVGLLTLILLPVSLPVRVPIMVTNGLAMFCGFFLMHPDNLEGDLAPGQMSFLLFTTVFSIVMGDVFYRTIRRGFFQQRLLARSQAEVSTLNAELASRVEDQTRELRTLAVYLERAQETERRRLSRELHDELGQDLTAMRYTLALLEQRYATQPTAIGALLDQLFSLLQRTTFTTRNIMTGLRPRVLDDLGLEAATRWLGGQIADTSGVPCALHIAPDIDRYVDGDTRVAFFRLIQEATTNALKHGAPSALSVTLKVREAWVEVWVEDDGRGFATDRVTGGFGLIGMRERVRAVAGKLEVRSEPGKGTVVWARIPVHDLDRGGDMTTTTDPGNTTDPGEGSR